MAAKYLFRLDDICPTMNWDHFNALQALFEKFDIKPIIGVIPDNKDEKLVTQPAQDSFWERIKILSDQGWVIAQHGYQHRYVTSSGGILNINQKSEFSGLSYEEQYEKIRQGKETLEKNLSAPVTWWMAPAHSFDRTTCKALHDLGFTHVTDGIALSPFTAYGLTWIPQQLWKPRTKLFGVWTICIHPNTITPDFLKQLELFLEKNSDRCIHPSAASVRNSSINTLYWYWWKFQYLVYTTLFR